MSYYINFLIKYFLKKNLARDGVQNIYCTNYSSLQWSNIYGISLLLFQKSQPAGPGGHAMQCKLKAGGQIKGGGRTDASLFFPFPGSKAPRIIHLFVPSHLAQ
jgi:hypothetical protein